MQASASKKVKAEVVEQPELEAHSAEQAQGSDPQDTAKAPSGNSFKEKGSKNLKQKSSASKGKKGKGKQVPKGGKKVIKAQTKAKVKVSKTKDNTGPGKWAPCGICLKTPEDWLRLWVVAPDI